MKQPVRILAYLWAVPNTAIGLLFVPVALAGGGRVRVVSGVLEVSGAPIAWCLTHFVPIPGGALALTLGHVVLGQTNAALETSRTHERVHVRQYERWGPLFLPAYFFYSLVAHLRGHDFYRDNRFEQEAYGEPEQPQ